MDETYLILLCIIVWSYSILFFQLSMV